MYTIHYISGSERRKTVHYINGGLQMIAKLVHQGVSIIKCVNASTGRDVTERIRGDFIQPLEALPNDQPES